MFYVCPLCFLHVFLHVALCSFGFVGFHGVWGLWGGYVFVMIISGGSV